MKKWTFIAASLMLMMLCNLLDAHVAQASHFRYGTLSYAPTGVSGQIKFRLIAAFRRNGFAGTAPDGQPKTGDIIEEDIGATNLFFGDGQNTPVLQFEVTAFSPSENFIIGEALDPGTTNRGVLHTYAVTGPTTAGISSCCRIGDLNNRADNSYQLLTRVQISTPNTSPVTSLAPIVTVPEDPAAKFTVPASDPNGDTIRFRLSSDSEAGGGSSPPNLSVNSTTGIVTWNNVGLDQTLFWTAQVIVEDLDSQGFVKSQAPVDFLLKIGQGTPPKPPSINPPGPFAVAPGELVTFSITGTDPAPNANLTLNTSGLPSGATMTPALPLSGVGSVTSTFNFTPTASQLGTFVVTYTVTNNTTGLQSISSVTIVVSNKEANLSVSKTGPASIAANGSITYTISVKNNGPDPAFSAVVTDTLPTGTSFTSSSLAPANNTATPLTFSLGNLANGASKSFTLTVSTSSAAGSSISNTATVASSTPDSTPGNDSSTAITTVGTSTSGIDLELTKTASFPTFVLPSTVSKFETFTLTVRNIGTVSAPNVVLTEMLPANLNRFLDIQPSALRSKTKVSGNNLIISLGTIPAGQTRVVQVLVAPNVVGTFINNATVSTTGAEANKTNNAAQATVVVTRNSAPTIKAKAAAPSQGKGI